MRNLIIIVIFLTLSEIYSQVLPQDRIYEWYKAGINSEIKYLDTIHLEDLGIVGDGMTLNDDVIAIAFAKMNPLTTLLVFPEGVFKFSKTIKIPSSVKLTGQGANKTKLIFDNSENGDLIVVSGILIKDTIKLKLDNRKGDMFLTIGNPKSLSKGDFIFIFDSDTEKITSDWAKNTSGQICQIESLNGSEVLLKSALRRDYSSMDSTFIFKISPAQFVQIENLSIERIDSTNVQTSNISFNFSANCKIKCIKSKNCNFAHIDIRNSSNIEIEGSYFEFAFNYGDGGKAYGVMIQSTSGECLVYNNIFKNLRHAMILQSGANGNVFSYNYSIEPYWTDVALPSNSAGDVVLHGNYPYANLFEGNICQNIVIDNSHGINGADNLFFRNRAELYGIFMNTQPTSNHQNFIGNEITNTDMLKGLYLLNGVEHFEYGNNIKGKILPTETVELNDQSYYLYEKPSWYENNSSYPPIGIPKKLNEFENEAKTRYKEGYLTSCEENVNRTEEIYTQSKNILIFPNPANNQIQIHHSENCFGLRIDIYNVLGENLTHKVKIEIIDELVVIDIQNLPEGNYLIFVKIGFKKYNSFFCKIQ